MGKNEYPVVDTSTSRHAVQGLNLEPGLNTLTVRFLVPAPKPGSGSASDKGQEKATVLDVGKGKDGEQKNYQVMQSRSISVYNRDGSFVVTPSRHAPSYFHSRENEGECSGCHRLEAEAKDFKHEKPQDVLCYDCHRGIPVGKYIHGPAAVWNCLSCHDPGRTPVKYQFDAMDPWKVTKTTRPVEPSVFTFSADALFVPQSAAPAGNKEKQRELFRGILEQARQNPLDRIRIEVHGSPLPTGGKGTAAKGQKDVQQLTDARAQALAKALQEYGVSDRGRILAAGMGSRMPKVAGTSTEALALNNRVEIIVYPQDLQIQSSLMLPSAADRERVAVDVNYARGAAVKNLKVIEQLPLGSQYVKGSAMLRGRSKEPQIKGSELMWQLGDVGTDFHESLQYVVKKEKSGDAAVSPALRLAFTSGQNEQTRDFDPSLPVRRGGTEMDICARCHAGVLSGPVRHGPADGGYCTLCHDPHASKYPAWTRNQAWRLCTTCHAEKKTEVHLISGFAKGFSHPTRKASDPSRPGKRITCVSCHSPHSAQTRELLGFDARSKFEICRYCHAGK